MGQQGRRTGMVKMILAMAFSFASKDNPIGASNLRALAKRTENMPNRARAKSSFKQNKRRGF